MIVTLKNIEIKERLARLQKMAELNPSLPVAVGYRAAQNEKTLRDALGPYDEAVKQIFAKYADGKDTIDRKTDPEAYDNVRKEIAALDALDADIEIRTVPFSAIEAQSNLPLSVFLALEFMISE
jgi:hypothetical protein